MQTHYWGCLVQPQNHDVWTKYEIDKPLANAEGGEGGIFTLKPHAGERRVAKLYNSASKSLLKPDAFKSLALLTSKYADLSKPTSLPFVAWPIEVLFTVKHPSSIQHLPTLAGITMRHVSGHGVLEKLTTNGNGRFGLGTEKAVRIAATIAHYLHRMHEHRIVFCDFNPKNILVSNDHTNITFVDADAFQHAFGTAFTKPHFFPGYASPAHIESKPGLRTPADDNFVLAIHIFQLLLDGGHPFDTGPAYNPNGDLFASITPHDNIKAKRWPYSNVALYQPPGETPQHYARLHPDLRAMFTRAFHHFTPPTAAEWEAVLPRFAANVEGSPPPPPKRPAPASPPLAKPAINPPRQVFNYTPPAKPAPNPAAPAYTPPPQRPQPPPVKPKLTAKRIAQSISWWALRKLLLLILSFGRLLWTASKPAISRLHAHDGTAVLAGLALVGLIFLGLNIWNTRLAESPSQITTSALQAPQPQPVIRNRMVQSIAVPQPSDIPLPTRKPTPPRMAEAEPEVLPWLQTPPPITGVTLVKPTEETRKVQQMDMREKLEQERRYKERRRRIDQAIRDYERDKRRGNRIFR